jgi:hypothetical protein
LIKVVLKTLKNEKEYSKNINKRKTFHDKPWSKPNKKEDQSPSKKRDKLNDLEPRRQKTLGTRENEKNNELTLAIVVLLANISPGVDFIGELLAQKSFNPIDEFTELQ